MSRSVPVGQNGWHIGADRTLLGEITRRAPILRRSEQKVASTVLNDPHAAVHTSMAELARSSGVSEPTVMRFCTAIDCESFQAFKLRLAQSVAFGVPATYSSIKPEDGSSPLVEKIFDYTIAGLAAARRALDDEQIGRAIELLVDAGDVLFLGLGASGIVAQDAQQKFPLFGVPCLAPADAHQQFIAASLRGPTSVVVAISNTGTTVSVLESVDVAKANGARIIAISGGMTPLLARADVPIIVETLENTDFYTPMHSRLAQLTIIDVLATGVVLRQTPEQIDRLRIAKARVAAMRTGRLDPTLEQTETEEDDKGGFHRP